MAEVSRVSKIFPSESDIPNRTISILQSLLKMVQHIDINGIQKIWQIPQGKNEQEPKAKATSKTL